MKKNFFFFLLLVSFSVLKAQDQPSSLQIRMWDNSLFAAVFGGDETGRYQRSYNVRTLAGGEYYLRMMQRGTEEIITVFEGQIEVPPGSRVQAVLLESGALEISVLEDTQPTESSTFDLKSKVEQIQTKVKGKEVTAEEERNERIESLEFMDLRNKILRAADDHVRDSLANDGLRKNTFTTSYVVELAKLFKNETSRLEFSKSAYTRVVDPENYFQIKDLFIKPENVQSLQEYMDKKNKAGEIQIREFQGLF